MKKTETGEKQKINVVSLIINILLWLFVIFAALVTVMALSSASSPTGLPNLWGYSPITVLSDSMSDTFNAGDLIICRQLTAEEKANLGPGDVITFRVDLNNDGIDEVNTHRIVEKHESGGYIYFTTRGDNAKTNTRNDDYEVRYDLVLAKYTGTRIPGLGNVFNFLSSSTGFLVCIVVPLIIVFLYQVYKFIVAIIRAKGSAITSEKEEELKRQAIEEYLAAQAEEQNAKKTGDGDKGGDEAAEPEQVEAGADEKPAAENTETKETPPAEATEPKAPVEEEKKTAEEAAENDAEPSSIEEYPSEEAPAAEEQNEANASDAEKKD